MKIFRWQGIDHNGLRVSGESSAENVNAVKQNLQQQHITVLRITRKIQLKITRRDKINFESITDFSREVATLLTSGVPLGTALAVISGSMAKNSLQQIILTVQKQIESGRLLSQALQAQPQYFDAIFCNLVYVGEQSGQLEKILQEITVYRGRISALKRKIKKALFYPLIVLFVALIVTAGLVVFVIPQFEKLFQGLGAQLPLLTRIIMQTAQQLRHYGWLLAIVIIIDYLLLRLMLKKSSRMRVLMAKLLLRIPIIGRSISNAIQARSFATLATALQAGVPMLEALAMTANVAGNSLYQNALMQLLHHIKSGQAMHVAMAKINFFSARVIQMIAIGEEAGRLEQMLRQLSDYFEKQVDDIVHNLSQLLEPVIMVFLCVVIGSIVIAMYLPIFLLGSVI